ncbi:MAG: hypothetical protein IKZ01_03470, partial [Anaerotignum sp.]|nr:hypothetical protein [Anaerotignum sp.]
PAVRMLPAISKRRSTKDIKKALLFRRVFYVTGKCSNRGLLVFHFTYRYNISEVMIYGYKRYFTGAQNEKRVISG